MLLYLSTSLSDETNLDRVVPYAVYYLRNEVVTVRALAINVLTQIVGLSFELLMTWSHSAYKWRLNANSCFA